MEWAHTRLEFAVLAYDAEGKLINFTEHAFGLDLTSEDYAKVMSGGLPQPPGDRSARGPVPLCASWCETLDSPRAGATEVPLTVAKN